MNKLILFLLFPVLVFNTSICEVLKAPQLVVHYIQHQEKDARITFLDFLEMHYFGRDLNDNDDEEDMKLPFKKVHGHHSLSIAVPSDMMVLVKSACLNIPNIRISSYCISISNPTYGSLFRPPISHASSFIV